jgi:iron complex transport system ATP-binding protein
VDARRLGAIVITHHVNLAVRFADRVLLLDAGSPAAEGTPEAVLTRATVERVFAWPVAIEQFQGRPQMIPLRKPTSR